MSKYSPFADFLRSQTADTIEISFDQLGSLVGGLPASAWNHDAWWANSSPGDSHTWAHQWAAAGWKCVSAKRRLGVAVFQRSGTNAVRRIPVGELRNVTPEHVWMAVQALLNGVKAEGFAPSTDYDLIVDEGIRLAPRHVFGIAATSAFGFEVTPAHFAGGLGTFCFELLEECGYKIIEKGEVTQLEVGGSEEFRWSEGSPKLVTHLRRERAPGLSKAKKSWFVRNFGRLYCEICKLDPIKVYGEIGASCIEVHHSSTHIANMGGGHKTALEDLQCLCANCHRIEHRRLRESSQE
ncbi:MAG: hypothetical protein P0Y58_12400 [Candidatus Pseudomonas phytovorans]|uniref:DUF7662 domain-containing protein n=1 Tax=Candidatus Pseudomonas phytovorans TaxID=3121377 RepID=A0AAJ6BE80_9PSED|nr:hypothetical protein [Pseudomonas sp.]WEK32947.1 MAG: hypothetical protein P0Y58_12400 [Pseudomonas sp.]